MFWLTAISASAFLLYSAVIFVIIFQSPSRYDPTTRHWVDVYQTFCLLITIVNIVAFGLLIVLLNKYLDRGNQWVTVLVYCAEGVGALWGACSIWYFLGPALTVLQGAFNFSGASLVSFYLGIVLLPAALFSNIIIALFLKDYVPRTTQEATALRWTAYLFIVMGIVAVIMVFMIISITH